MRDARRRPVAAPVIGLAVGCGETRFSGSRLSPMRSWSCVYERLEHEYLLRTAQTRSAIFGSIDVQTLSMP